MLQFSQDKAFKSSLKYYIWLCKLNYWSLKYLIKLYWETKIKIAAESIE